MKHSGIAAGELGESTSHENKKSQKTTEPEFVLHDSARIFLEVWEHNPGATQFYERYGFVVIGDRSFAVASGAETSLDLIMGQLSNALCVVVNIELY